MKVGKVLYAHIGKGYHDTRFRWQGALNTYVRCRDIGDESAKAIAAAHLAELENKLNAYLA